MSLCYDSEMTRVHLEGYADGPAKLLIRWVRGPGGLEFDQIMKVRHHRTGMLRVIMSSGLAHTYSVNAIERRDGAYYHVQNGEFAVSTYAEFCKIVDEAILVPIGTKKVSMRPEDFLLKLEQVAQLMQPGGYMTARQCQEFAKREVMSDDFLREIPSLIAGRDDQNEEELRDAVRSPMRRSLAICYTAEDIRVLESRGWGLESFKSKAGPYAVFPKHVTVPKNKEVI